MLIPFSKLPKNIVKGVIHVGAHEAEELESYASHGLTKVLWIEPNPQKKEQILSKIHSYPDMFLGEFAAAESTGYGSLNIATNGQSSSLLPFGTHTSSYPSISYHSTITVRLNTVDLWIEELQLRRSDFNFLNLDTQGYELSALKGMDKQLAFVDLIYTEVNYTQVYLGCPHIYDLDNFLSTYGFQRVLTLNSGHGWGDALYSRYPSRSFHFLILYYHAYRLLTFAKAVLKRFNHTI